VSNQFASRSTEHSDFLLRFANKLVNEGNIVYKYVPQSYWSTEEKRTIKGKIDLVAVKNNFITAYELETANAQQKSIAKLKSFDCNSAYIICHNGKAIKIK
jgi:competence protein ComGC